MKYWAIRDHSHRYPIRLMCRAPVRTDMGPRAGRTPDPSRGRGSAPWALESAVHPRLDFWLQDAAAHQIESRERTDDEEPLRVLAQTPVTDFRGSEDPFDDPFWDSLMDLPQTSTTSPGPIDLCRSSAIA